MLLDQSLACKVYRGGYRPITGRAGVCVCGVGRGWLVIFDFGRGGWGGGCGVEKCIYNVGTYY